MTLTFIASACSSTPAPDSAEPALQPTTSSSVEALVENEPLEEEELAAEDPASIDDGVDAEERRRYCEAGQYGTEPATCPVVTPIQPSSETIDELDQVFRAVDGFDIEGHRFSSTLIVVDGVPFRQYWQLDDPNDFVLHPMSIGSYLFRNVDDDEVRNSAPDIIASVGTQTPNGGSAFFYPNLYPLNRFRGPDYIYSAISQSEIMAAFVLIDQLEGTPETRDRLASVRDALFLDYEEGGVSLAGVAQLEVPLFRSNPEIILNGWLHSLLHLNDYAIAYDDADVAAYVRANLRFFVDNNAAWYDDERNISRYSDTSPQRVIITPQTDGGEFDLDVRTVYAPLADELQPYVVPFADDPSGSFGGFDNRIVATGGDLGNAASAVVNCSLLFRTTLVADAPFSARIKDNGYEVDRATPGAEGTWHDLDSEPAPGGLHRLELTLDDAELLCGYPTNFAKANGKNYYHVQHIVALSYLANFGQLDDPALTEEINAIASSWYRRSADFGLRPIADFESPQLVLEGINRGKVFQSVTDVEVLFRAAGIELFDEHRP